MELSEQDVSCLLCMQKDKNHRKTEPNKQKLIDKQTKMITPSKDNPPDIVLPEAALYIKFTIS